MGNYQWAINIVIGLISSTGIFLYWLVKLIIRDAILEARGRVQDDIAILKREIHSGFASKELVDQLEARIERLERFA